MHNIFRFWIASSLFCGLNGLLMYLVAPQTAANAASPYVSAWMGGLIGLALAALATVAFAAFAFFRRGRP
jgi:hypothetical protein